MSILFSQVVDPPKDKEQEDIYSDYKKTFGKSGSHLRPTFISITISSCPFHLQGQHSFGWIHWTSSRRHEGLFPSEIRGHYYFWL